jgi:hypothetical protein
MGFAPGPGAVMNWAMMSLLGSWNTPLRVFGKPGASPVHDPSQGLVQEPDLPDDVQAAHVVQLDGRELLPGQRPALASTVAGIASLPTSCSIPVWRIASVRLARMPISRRS